MGSRRQTGWISALLLALTVAVGGCGDSNLFGSLSDDSSEEGKREAGIEALNQGDYAEAARIFEELWAEEQTPEVAKYLSSAYVGEAGFDTLTLVEEIAKAQEAEDGADTESIIYDSVTRIFDTDGDGLVTEGDLEGKVDLLRQALMVLIPGYGIDLAPRAQTEGAAPAGATPTDEIRFQAGMYAAVDAVLGVVSQLANPDEPGQFLLTLDALRGHAEVVQSVMVPDGFAENLALVEDARDVLIAGLSTDGVDGNEIAAEFDQFLTDIGYLPDRDVSAQELRDYLQRLVDESGEVTP